MGLIMNIDNKLRPGPSPINYFVAFNVFNEKTGERITGDEVLCTSESRKQMGESIIREMGMNPDECNIVFTSLTVLDPYVANQLIYGCGNILNK